MPRQMKLNMKIKYIFLALIPFVLCGAYPPINYNSNTASSDVLANSSDTHSLGVLSDYWKESYVAYMRIPHHMVPPTSVTSFGVLYVSTDKSLRFRKDDGSETVLVA